MVRKLNKRGKTNNKLLNEKNKMSTLVNYNRFPSAFDQAVARQFNQFLGWPTATPQRNTFVPAVNVKEDEQAFHLEVVVPGLKKENFTINILNNRLTVSAKQEEATEEKSEKFTRKEFSFSGFERSFQLPKNVNSEQIKAAYTDGILKIEIPKVEQPVLEPKQIAVA